VQTQGIAVDLYFAYGSNMSTRRLRTRIAGAQPLGCARLDGWRLTCNKPGVDRSGKANLVFDGQATAWGVLFQLQMADWPILDRFEPGYQRCQHEVRTPDGGDYLAHVYLAAGDTREIPPFDWYLAHLIEGAQEHRLPVEYVYALERRTVLRSKSDSSKS